MIQRLDELCEHFDLSRDELNLDLSTLTACVHRLDHQEKSRMRSHDSLVWIFLPTP